MKSPFSLFLALRYLKPKRTFVSIITVISVLGVTLGIAVLLVVIAVMTGFDRELQRKVLGFEPHVTIGSDRFLPQWRPIVDHLGKEPDVVASAPYVEGPVIAEHEGQVMTPILRAIDAESEQKIHDLRTFLVGGSLDLNGDNVVIGRILAEKLGLGLGDKVVVYAPSNIRGIMEELRKEADDPNAKAKTLQDLKNEIVLPAELTVTGVFESGRYSIDSGVLFVPLHLGQELYSLGDGVHGISVVVKDPYQAEKVRDSMNRWLTADAFAETWIDRNRDQFEAIRVERNVMFIILTFLSVIASFSIMNTLITVTVQKRREIGILKALGANTGQIIRVFFLQGVIVGFIGTVCGLVLGILMVHVRNEFKDWLARTLHIELLPPSIYQFSELPAEIVPRDVATICLITFALCACAALIPAWFAARLDPVKALRYE